MADFNALEAQFSNRQPNTIRYLCEINSEAVGRQKEAGQVDLR